MRIWDGAYDGAENAAVENEEDEAKGANLLAQLLGKVLHLVHKGRPETRIASDHCYRDDFIRSDRGLNLI